MSKKYQVFVSSTYQDLTDERDQVIRAILEMGHIPVGMEMFSAADEEQWKIIARQIDEIDYYVLIVAHRYGSVTPDGVSYTEKEFDYAVSKGVPILGFLLDNSAPWPNDRHEKDSGSKDKLDKFKTKVKQRLIQFWTNKDDLHGKVSISLMKSITGTPRIGWIRANQMASADVVNELSRLSSENATLRAQVAEAQRVRATQNDEVRKVIHILGSNTRKITVRTKDNPVWDLSKSRAHPLSEVFGWAAPGLIDENSSLGVAQNIALKLVGTTYLPEWPIGKNVVSDILADLAALDLVEPSKKKHAVSDTKSYWQLTTLGKQTLKQLRRVLLEEGLSTPATTDEET